MRFTGCRLAASAQIFSRTITFTTNRQREDDRPAVQVALDERAAAERAGAGADAEGARQARVLARVEQDRADQDDREDDLEAAEDRLPSAGKVSGRSAPRRSALELVELAAGSRSPARAARGRCARQSASESLPIRWSSSASRISRYFASLAASSSARALVLAASASPPRRSGSGTSTTAATSSGEHDQARARTPRAVRYARDSSRPSARRVEARARGAARLRRRATAPAARRAPRSPPPIQIHDHQRRDDRPEAAGGGSLR